MKNFLYITFLSLVITACKPGIPSNVIQPDKMVLILSDTHVIDGYITNIPNADSARIVASSFYQGLYKKYGIDSAQFAKSMFYYNRDPKAMDEIYTQVLVKLNQQKNVVTKTDSISNAIKMKKAMNHGFYDVEFLLRDTTKKKLDVIQPKIIYQEPK